MAKPSVYKFSSDEIIVASVYPTDKIATASADNNKITGDKIILCEKMQP